MSKYQVYNTWGYGHRYVLVVNTELNRLVYAHSSNSRWQEDQNACIARIRYDGSPCLIGWSLQKNSEL